MVNIVDHMVNLAIEIHLPIFRINVVIYLVPLVYSSYLQEMDLLVQLLLHLC
ncbi:unnamed protein product [Schistosoma curassoni]|uniref:Uncharacterized protein n=1 Tax=Schistosoma curassoni TaxID=6186 RepID=A0A183KHN5_9TREM|nr:unnamed protein product [Schistosoma curassoni]